MRIYINEEEEKEEIMYTYMLIINKCKTKKKITATLILTTT